MNEIYSDYFYWLCSHIVDNKHHLEDYHQLLSYLHSIEFRWLIPNDKNRALDGNRLRYKYCEFNDRVVTGLQDNLPCISSVLEMLIALSIRCEYDIMHDPDMGDNTSFWFWTMLDNAGLTYFDNDHFDIDAVSNAIWVVMDRLYSSDGQGGFFPLHTPPEDQRSAELWSQLNLYLDENFDF